jgi:alkanesulfonate monooxygenase SsuD/methylene tetrahydromethanopterin reductase-like flavin-dependent oxidoreductase (luciferase family)
MEIWVHFDLRAPEWGVPREALYAAAIEQAAWADEQGFDGLGLPEHHGAEDGYISSPMIVAGAMASRTKRLKIVRSVVLAPLHDPLHLAEDLAVLDLVSGGRLQACLGMGYRRTDFNMFGVDPKDRVRLTEECFSVLRQAFTGEPFEFRGRHVRVTPPPSQPGGPPLLLAGSVPATARRAARLADGFFPFAVPGLVDIYKDECAALGKQPGLIYSTTGPSFLYVSHDPERSWNLAMPHVMHYMNSYAAWTREDPSMAEITPYDSTDDPAVVRASHEYRVVTPDQAVELLRELEPTCSHVAINPLLGGLPPELGWESLELFANEVLPKFRAPAASRN